MALRRTYLNFRGNLPSLDGHGCIAAAITSAYADTDDDLTLDDLAPGAESAVIARVTSADFAWDTATADLLLDPTTVTIDATGEADLAGWVFADAATGLVVSLLRYADGGVAAPQVGTDGWVIAPAGGRVGGAVDGAELEARVTALEAALASIDGGTP